VSAGERERRDPRARRRAPASLDEALLRASEHARAAAGEAALAARCLLDAASLGATGVPAEAHEPLRRAARWLDAFAAERDGEAGRWLHAVADALDAEIARWESRSHADPEARAVLRAFLGLRELLWELGLRREAARRPGARPGPRPARAPAAAPTPAQGARRGGAARLERVPIDGAAPPGGRADRSGAIR